MNEEYTQMKQILEDLVSVFDDSDLRGHGYGRLVEVVQRARKFETEDRVQTFSDGLLEAARYCELIAGAAVSLPDGADTQLVLLAAKDLRQKAAGERSSFSM